MRARNQSGWVEETGARSWKAQWYEYVKDPQTGVERPGIAVGSSDKRATCVNLRSIVFHCGCKRWP